jgi:hypothetical protein
MKVRLRDRAEAVRAGHKAGRIEEYDIPSPADLGITYPAQVIIDPTAKKPEVVEGTAILSPDGDIEILLPLAPIPKVGTPVQLIIYTPLHPTVQEGKVAEPSGDGTIPIILD